ncbi:RNA polymerase sigma-70 factor [Aestuariivivens marinum]|uniref:RNA polymerase sigma-70 factor n=1 Tax=Aestuariivivens marinum TaxID=2913555 RepID=UPI001F5AFCEF|nr:RNA polymerase sigma-70 factor [Aestuariivivens marinum]
MLKREDLFYQFKNGDEKAFKFYFDKYLENIIGFCVQFLYDEDKAKSVAQEAFIKLWVNRGKLVKENGISAFLYTSAKSDCLNLIRHNKVVSKYKDVKLQEYEDKLNLEVLDALQFDPLHFSELELLIEKAINDLPIRCKEVFVKRRKEDKKVFEIAKELGISIKAVEANMTRATKELRLKLAHHIPLILMVFINL